MQPTAHLKFIGGKLHQWWQGEDMCFEKFGEWRLVESE